MAIGVLSLLGFQLVDSAFVARLGTEPLAAQSFTFPLTFLMIGVQVGLGIAMAAMISRAMGSGDADRAQRLASLVLIGGSAIMAVLAIGLWLFQAPLFRMLGADGEMLGRIRAYWAPQLAANWLGGVVYFGYTLFRAHNNTRLPGTLMVLTSLCNLVLDPVLIFGVGGWAGFGLPGAAIATILAFTVAVVLLVWRVSHHDWLSGQGLIGEAKVSTSSFVTIAGPAMLSQLMPPLSAMVATGLIARLGDSAVAAWGLASRLETVSLMVVLALTMSLPPWLGHCYGAGNWPRIRALMRVATQAVVVWQLLLGITMCLLAPWIAQALTGNPEVRHGLTWLIRFMLPSYALLGLCMLVVSAGNALGWPLRALAISFARLFVCYLPCIAVGVWADSMVTVGMGAAVGNLLAGALACIAFYRSLQGVPATRSTNPSRRRNES